LDTARNDPRTLFFQRLVQARKEKEGWCAQRDSNSRPIAPEAIALSS
jgi:hypothetical protein